LWWRRRKAGPNIRHNSPAHSADSVILVGSESNSTWGFAKTLHDTLHAAGQSAQRTDEQLCEQPGSPTTS
jgi:sulfite reductase (NADPH) flavoprotein alpha-component